MIAIMLAACSGGSDEPKPADAADAAASRGLADALCKLVEGAGTDCERVGDKAKIGSTTVTTEVWLDGGKEQFNLYEFDGRAILKRDDGTTITTRFNQTDWGKDEAVKKGTHYWAVLSGSAVADWVLADPNRPALRALETDNPPSRTHWTIGSKRALRGWTLMRGVQVELDHPAILETLKTNVDALPDGPHVAHIEISSDLGEQLFTCHLDGAPAPEWCQAAKAYTWPAGIGWELQQVYLLVDPATFPEAPPLPLPVEEAEAEPEAG